MKREEFDKIVFHLTLETCEMEGGHALERHFGQTNYDLIERCVRLRKHLATAFDVSRTEALSLIQQTLLDEEYETPECILEWLSDESDGGDFYAIKDFNKRIGHGFFRKPWHEWNNGPAPCHSLCVVLRKVERTTDTTFRIVTVYPTVCEADILEMYDGSYKSA